MTISISVKTIEAAFQGVIITKGGNKVAQFIWCLN